MSNFPIVHGVRTTIGDPAVTNHTVLLPDGSDVIGYLIQVYVTIDDTPSVISDGIPGPPAFTLGVSVDGGGLLVDTYFRIVDGSENYTGIDDSLVFIVDPAKVAVFHVVTLANWFGTVPYSFTTQTSGTSTNADPPNNTAPEFELGDHLWIAYAGLVGAPAVTGYPASYDLHQSNIASGGGGGVTGAIAMRELRATSDDPGPFTTASANWVALTTAFEDAPQGPTPFFLSAGAFAFGIGAITPGAPGGLATDDIELLLVESADEAVTLSTADGFAEVTGSPVSAPGALAEATRLTLFWRRFAGQGNPTIADAGDHVLARRVAFRGCIASGDPWDITVASSETVADTSGSATGGTTTDANRLVVACLTSALPDANSTSEISAIANADLSAVTEHLDNARATGNGGHLGLISGGKAAAGAFGATTYTKVTAGFKSHLVVALKPVEVEAGSVPSLYLISSPLRWISSLLASLTR
jgi:hypothetical protein